ncbi:MAG: hypothetical protein QOF33_3963 [Thermomicrobiales bacterium]|nr:hypothetical protein [Thermomicrobiales bacterium]
MRRPPRVRSGGPSPASKCANFASLRHCMAGDYITVPVGPPRLLAGGDEGDLNGQGRDADRWRHDECRGPAVDPHRQAHSYDARNRLRGCTLARRRRWPTEVFSRNPRSPFACPRYDGRCPRAPGSRFGMAARARSDDHVLASGRGNGGASDQPTTVRRPTRRGRRGDRAWVATQTSGRAEQQEAATPGAGPLASPVALGGFSRIQDLTDIVTPDFPMFPGAPHMQNHPAADDPGEWLLQEPAHPRPAHRHQRGCTRPLRGRRRLRRAAPGRAPCRGAGGGRHLRPSGE